MLSLLLAALALPLARPAAAAPLDASQLDEGVEAASIEQIKAAAERGEPKGQFQLGLCYEFGLHGLPADKGKALEWESKAAAQGQPSLANWAAEAAEGERRIPQALKLYGLAAKGGNRDAYRNLGRMHIVGVDVPRDQSKAVAYYSKAVALGDSKSVELLALARFQCSGDPKCEAARAVVCERPDGFHQLKGKVDEDAAAEGEQTWHARLSIPGMQCSVSAKTSQFPASYNCRFPEWMDEDTAQRNYHVMLANAQAITAKGWSVSDQPQRYAAGPAGQPDAVELSAAKEDKGWQVYLAVRAPK